MLLPVIHIYLSYVVRILIITYTTNKKKRVKLNCELYSYKRIRLTYVNVL